MNDYQHIIDTFCFGLCLLIIFLYVGLALKILDYYGFSLERRQDYYLRKVFQNDITCYKRTYRYFCENPFVLVINSVLICGYKDCIISDEVLRKWLLGIAAYQRGSFFLDEKNNLIINKKDNKQVQIKNFLMSLKLEFESVKQYSGSSKDKINHANQFIEMIDELTKMLEEEKAKHESDNDFFDAYTRAEEKYASTMNKIKDTNESLNSDVNPELVKTMLKIENQMAESKHYSDSRKQQWKNTIKPMLIETISKKQLSEENKKKVMDILNTVSENINKSEIDFADTETAASLSSLESFMSMNGW